MGEDTSKLPLDREPDAPFVILDPPQQAAPDLVCPNCDYNLAGLTEDRCPECGQPFDRAELTRWYTATNLPLPLGRPGPLPFRERIFYLSIFAPARLGRGLPPLASTEASRNFSVLVRALATGLLCTLILIIDGLMAAIGAALLLELVSRFCEAAISSILARYVRPRAVPDHYRANFWGILCRCFAGHLLLTVGGVTVCVVVAGLMDFEALAIAIFGLPVLTTLFWSFCLGSAVRTRGVESSGRTLAILLIPLCGAGAIILFILLMTITQSVLRGF